METHDQMSKKPKNDEGLDTKDILGNTLDKGKGVLQITEWSSEEETTPTTSHVSINHFSSALLSSRESISSTSEGSSQNQPTLFSHYSDIMRNNQVIRREFYSPINGQTKMFFFHGLST